MKTINLMWVFYIITMNYLFADKGVINIETREGLDIFVNNKYKGVAGNGITKLKLQEGTYQLKVLGKSKDDEWDYRAEKEIFLGEDMEITTVLTPIKSPSATRSKRLDKIAKIIQDKLKEADIVKSVGFYQSVKKNNSWKYFCLYDNGIVIAVSSTGTPIEIKKWFTYKKFLKEKQFGEYKIDNNKISFSIMSSSGTVDYEGIKEENRLILNSYSHINGYSSKKNVYKLISQ